MEECGGILVECCWYYIFCGVICCTFLEEKPKPVAQSKQTVTPLRAITPEIAKHEMTTQLGYKV